MPDTWLILLAVAGLFALGAVWKLDNDAKSRSDTPNEPTSPPAGPGAEGMLVSGPGDVSPGEPDQRQTNKE